MKSTATATSAALPSTTSRSDPYSTSSTPTTELKNCASAPTQPGGSEAVADRPALVPCPGGSIIMGKVCLGLTRDRPSSHTTEHAPQGPSFKAGRVLRDVRL